ncbi:MAG TPA: hypothetical protein VHR45_25780 [Thermoanaerobaculia bacterium]|nr:hypothetical protein [Thermoanaerobaculia bacterium]
MLIQHLCPLPILGRLVFAAFSLLGLLGEGALRAQESSTTVSCPFFGRGTSGVYHGFYVTGYTGTNISTVTLGYTTDTPGRFSISLTARRNSFDGPLIGTTQTATVHVGGPLGETLVTFDFGAAPVSPGDTVAFIQSGGEIASDNSQFGSLFFDAGTGSCNGVFETQGTSPPLDSVILSGVGITITQAPGRTFFCVPSDTVLCLDDRPGDQRFKVSASFHTTLGGGRSGNAQAMPLAALGAGHGGLLWFFDPATPEVLVKIVNGCAISDHYWAFISAATNAGFTVTIADTFLADTKSYTNPDLTAAAPIQDTSALPSCHPCTSNAECPAGLLCCPEPPGGITQCLPPQPGGGCPLFP